MSTLHVEVYDVIYLYLIDTCIGDLRENVLSNAHKGCGPLDLSGMTDVSMNDGVTLFRPLLPLEKVIWLHLLCDNLLLPLTVVALVLYLGCSI